MKLFRLLFVLLLAVLLSGAVLLRTYQPDGRAAIWLEVTQAKAAFALRKAGHRGKILAGEGKEKLSELYSIFRSNSAQIQKNLFSYTIDGVEGGYRVSDEEIVEATQILDQPWIWQQSPADIQASLGTLPWIEQHSLSWSLFPLRVSVSVREAEPWLVVEYEGHSWLLSRNNKLIVPLDSLSDSDVILEASDLPRVGGLRQEQKFSSYLSSENARLLYITKMISFLELAKTLPFSIERYELQADGSLVVAAKPLSGLPSVRLRANSFSEAETLREQLQTVLDDLRTREEKVELVDLRFENQAVVR